MSHTETKTAIVVCRMLITFLKELVNGIPMHSKLNDIHCNLGMSAITRTEKTIFLLKRVHLSVFILIRFSRRCTGSKSA